MATSITGVRILALAVMIISRKRGIPSVPFFCEIASAPSRESATPSVSGARGQCTRRQPCAAYRADARKVERVERHLRGRLADGLRGQQAHRFTRVRQRVAEAKPHKSTEGARRERILPCPPTRTQRHKRSSQ